MDALWKKISQHKPKDTQSEEDIYITKSEIEKLVSKDDALRLRATERLRAAREEYERKLIKDTKATQSLKALEMEMQLLRRGTNLKFTGPNSGVLLHHGKPKQFVIPSKGNKFQTINDLWDILNQSHVD